MDNINKNIDIIKPISLLLKKIKPSYLYIILLLPLLALIIELMSGGLGVDPMRKIERELGDTGLNLLIFTLALTPITKLTSFNLIRYKRVFGLMSFFYITLHFLTWLLLDMQLRWDEIIISLTKKPFIVLGMVSLVLLVPLAITSNNYSIRKLSNYWKRVHFLVYPAVIIGGLHYLLMAKTIQFDAVKTLIIILLLITLKFFKLKRIKWL